MGKKSKKKSSSNKTARSAQVVRAAPTPSVDREGRMPEAEGRRFYALLDFLALIVVPRMQIEVPSLRWNPQGCAVNSIETRSIVMDYLLQHIEGISQEIESGQHDALFRRLVGRRMTTMEKSTIRSLRVHLSDDFFVVDHIPKKGSVLVQVGRMLRDIDKEELGPCYRKDDVHEPRVFLLRGLATPFGELCQRPAEHFASAHPDVEYDLPIALVNLTVIPYGGGLTYMTNLTPETQQHYSSPAAYAEGARIAVEAYQAAFSGGPDAPKIYTHLTDQDTAICRLASNAENSFQKNVQHRNMLRNDRFERDATSSANTSLRCAVMLWNPLNDTNDPRFAEYLTEAAFGPRPVLELREGFKRQVGQEILVADDDPCPFHRHMGKGTAFVDCCKQAHLETQPEVYFYNPLKEEEGEFVMETGTDPFNLFRLAVIDTCSVKVKVGLDHVSEIEERLDASDIFHATNHYKWNYLGYFPAVWKDMGMAVFGDVTLDPSSGELTSEGMTSERVTALIHAMSHICDGIPVEDASVVSTPFEKRKVDKEALARNVALVEDVFGVEASFRKDKKAFAGKKCAYCDSRVEEDLRRCPCKKIYYCSKEHQRLHWKTHKQDCSAKKK